jgi:hypothetical protein
LAAAAAGCLPAEVLSQEQQQQQQGGVAAASSSSVSVVCCGLQEMSGECVVCRGADSSKGPLALLAFVQVRLTCSCMLVVVFGAGGLGLKLGQQKGRGITTQNIGGC